MSTVKINIRVVERTSLALLVTDFHKEAWVPWSQIEEAIQKEGPMGPEISAIVIPQWLAESTGLKPHQQDDDTLDLFEGAP